MENVGQKQPGAQAGETAPQGPATAAKRKGAEMITVGLISFFVGLCVGAVAGSMGTMSAIEESHVRRNTKHRRNHSGN